MSSPSEGRGPSFETPGVRERGPEGPPSRLAAWEPFVERALDSIVREYPTHVVHWMNDDADARPPRELTPVFRGCFDWHSAVHVHWSLVRALRCGLDGPLAERATTLLHAQLAPAGIAAEHRYLSAPERAGFERPYGLAWLLQLGAELREWESPVAFAWLDALAPLESLAADRLSSWLPRLEWPIRSGEHAQTAFAMGLALDWARIAGDSSFERLLQERARTFHLEDQGAPVGWEPSGHDFLSPVLAEADLMRRVLEPAAFGEWLTGLVPDWDAPIVRRWLTPVGSSDRADGKLAHLDGLNTSRAWMLEGIASSVPPGDPRRAILERDAARHAHAGVTAARESAHYAGTHWLGSFAIYLISRRGIRA